MTLHPVSIDSALRREDRAWTRTTLPGHARGQDRRGAAAHGSPEAHVRLTDHVPLVGLSGVYGTVPTVANTGCSTPGLAGLGCAPPPLQAQGPQS